MPNTYDRGSRVRVFGEFRSTGGALADPTVVRVKYRSPGSTLTTLQYSASTAVVRASTGSYYSDINVTTEGEWIYQWDSSGTVRASAEKKFRVRPGII